jgi:glycosyltransferase involved in cell wall biosynthesis
MLTVLEVGHVDDDRVRELRVGPDPELRRVLVRPGRATWTEAYGRETVVEHVAAARWPALVGGAALRDLVQLHRPAAIACGWPGVSPLSLQLAGARLVPRPVLIGIVHGGVASVVRRELAGVNARLAEFGVRASSWWGAHSLASFDAVFVDSRRAARRLWGPGVDRIYHVPRGVDLEEFSPLRRDPDRVEMLERGAARARVALAIGPEIDAPLLRRLHAALRRALPSEPALVIIDRSRSSSEPRARLARFADGFEHVHLPECSEPSERARWLAACEVAVVLPGLEAGPRCAEAMACGLPVAVVGSEVDPLETDLAVALVEASEVGRVLSEADSELLADAIVGILRLGSAAIGGRARSFVERIGLRECLARERLCVREVIEHVRSSGRVPSGIHERMQPPELRS